MANRPPLTSKTYPYFKVIQGANTMRGAELIPYKLLLYLLDQPDSLGYVPPDDNDYPRCRLAKYLWYDTPNPLAEARPTAAQMRSVLFDPDNPDINTDELKAAHPKGYRLYWQRMVGQSQLDAQTLLKCYIGRIFEAKKFETTIGITWEIWVNVNLATNTRTTAYDRSFDIEQCLHEALDGVNIGGVGTISFARPDHVYNGSEALWDENTALGRIINCSVYWSESDGERPSSGSII